MPPLNHTNIPEVLQIRGELLMAMEREARLSLHCASRRKVDVQDNPVAALFACFTDPLDFELFADCPAALRFESADWDGLTTGELLVKAIGGGGVVRADRVENGRIVAIALASADRREVLRIGQALGPLLNPLKADDSEITIIIAAYGCDLPAAEEMAAHGCEIQELYEVANSIDTYVKEILSISGSVASVAAALIMLMRRRHVSVQVGEIKIEGKWLTSAESAELLKAAIEALHRLRSEPGRRVEIRPLTREPGQKD